MLGILFIARYSQTDMQLCTVCVCCVVLCCVVVVCITNN